MPRPLRVEGTVQLDGPHGRLTVTGTGSEIEVRIGELRRVPFLLRAARRASGPPIDRWLGEAELNLAFGIGRWLPLRVRPGDPTAGSSGWRVSLVPWRFRSRPRPSEVRRPPAPDPRA